MVDEEPPHERATSNSLFFLYVYLFGCFFLYLIKLYGHRSSEKIDERRELECALQTC